MTPEAGFQLGIPLLLSLPIEVREELVKIARKKSPNAAINAALLAVPYSSGRTQMERERIAKTIRWLAKIRRDNQNNPKVFENAVNIVLPATSMSTDSKSTDKEENRCPKL